MVCKICRKEKFEKLILDHGIFFKCTHCELLIRDNDDIVSESREVSRYLTHNNSIFNSKYKNYLKKCIKDLQLEKLKNNSKILDYGCGYQPVLSELLRGMGFEVHNYDLYFNSDEKKLKIKYDAIVSIEVFEHLLYPLETVELLKSLLNPNGRLFISTRLYPDNSEELTKWWYMKDETHIIFFNKNTFKYIETELHFSSMVIKDNKYITLNKGH